MKHDKKILVNVNIWLSWGFQLVACFVIFLQSAVDSVIQRLNNPGQVFANRALNIIKLITTGPKHD